MCLRSFSGVLECGECELAGALSVSSVSKIPSDWYEYRWSWVYDAPIPPIMHNEFII